MDVQLELLIRLQAVDIKTTQLLETIAALSDDPVVGLLAR